MTHKLLSVLLDRLHLLLAAAAAYLHYEVSSNTVSALNIYRSLSAVHCMQGLQTWVRALLAALDKLQEGGKKSEDMLKAIKAHYQQVQTSSGHYKPPLLPLPTLKDIRDVWQQAAAKVPAANQQLTTAHLNALNGKLQEAAATLDGLSPIQHPGMAPRQQYRLTSARRSQQGNDTGDNGTGQSGATRGSKRASEPTRGQPATPHLERPHKRQQPSNAGGDSSDQISPKLAKELESDLNHTPSGPRRRTGTGPNSTPSSAAGQQAPAKNSGRRRGARAQEHPPPKQARR